MEKIYDLLEDIRPEFDYHESDDFIADGMLDSFDVVALVSDLEEVFSVKIDGLDIVPSNFVSVEAIAAMVKKNGGSV